MESTHGKWMLSGHPSSSFFPFSLGGGEVVGFHVGLGVLGFRGFEGLVVTGIQSGFRCDVLLSPSHLGPWD